MVHAAIADGMAADLIACIVSLLADVTVELVAFKD